MCLRAWEIIKGCEKSGQCLGCVGQPKGHTACSASDRSATAQQPWQHSTHMTPTSNWHQWALSTHPSLKQIGVWGEGGLPTQPKVHPEGRKMVQRGHSAHCGTLICSTAALCNYSVTTVRTEISGVVTVSNPQNGAIGARESNCTFASKDVSAPFVTLQTSGHRTDPRHCLSTKHLDIYAFWCL